MLNVVAACRAREGDEALFSDGSGCRKVRSYSETCDFQAGVQLGSYWS